MFLMTSGLRSVRDKALTYFDEIMDGSDQPPQSRLFKMANVFAEQIRRVAGEDQESLEKSGLPFNIHALVGGQLAGDVEHKLYMIYPQGQLGRYRRGDALSHHRRQRLRQAGARPHAQVRRLAAVRPQGGYAGVRLDADQRGRRRFPSRYRAVRQEQLQNAGAAVREERLDGKLRTCGRNGSANASASCRSIGRSRCWNGCRSACVLQTQGAVDEFHGE